LEQLSQQGALTMLKESPKLTRSFKRFLIEDFLPTLTPEQRLAGLGPEQRLAGLEEDEVLKALLGRLPKQLASVVTANLKPHSRRRSTPRRSPRRH
jgi:hypothetical protein